MLDVCWQFAEMMLTTYIVVRRTRMHMCRAGRRPFTHRGAPTQGQLILVRHGESVATEQKRFGSWMDVSLTSKGIESARRCATLLRAEGLQDVDVCYTSLLSRTIKTAWVLLEELNQMFIPVSPQWRLNERHYGNLTGLIKKEVVAQFGQDQVQIWRRSLETPPPPMTKDHFLYDQIHKSRQFRCMPYIPGSESLADVRARLIPLLQGELAQDLAAGKRVLICGHSNSLRALITLLEGVERVELKQLNIPYGFPIIYDLGTNLKPLGPRRILGDVAAVEEAYKKLFEETASLQRTSSGEA